MLEELRQEIDSSRRDPACTALMEFLLEHPHTRFSRPALLNVCYPYGQDHMQQTLGRLLDLGLVAQEADSDFFYLAD